MKVEQVVPILNVSDVEASFAWFAKLGWSRQFEWDADDPERRQRSAACAATAARSSSAATARAAEAAVPTSRPAGLVAGEGEAQLGDEQGAGDVDAGRAGARLTSLRAAAFQATCAGSAHDDHGRRVASQSSRPTSAIPATPGSGRVTWPSLRPLSASSRTSRSPAAGRDALDIGDSAICAAQSSPS